MERIGTWYIYIYIYFLKQHFTENSGFIWWWRHGIGTFPHYWPYAMGMHCRLVYWSNKGPVMWMYMLHMFPLLSSWTSYWTNSVSAGSCCWWFETPFCHVASLLSPYRNSYDFGLISFKWTKRDCAGSGILHTQYVGTVLFYILSTDIGSYLGGEVFYIL